MACVGLAAMSRLLPLRLCCSSSCWQFQWEAVAIGGGDFLHRCVVPFFRRIYHSARGIADYSRVRTCAD